MSFRTTTADQKFPKAAFWASMLVGAVIALGANPARAADAVVSVGSTCRSTGPHLKLEIRSDGQLFNAESFLGQAFAAIDIAPGATDQGHAHEGFFDAAPVAYVPFRTLTPAGHP